MNIMYVIKLLDIMFYTSRKRKAKFIYFIVILNYVIISGASMSSIRAAVMAILLIFDINTTSKDTLKGKYLNIAISYIIILIYNPYSIFNVSGIFSYLATLGIITFYTLINSAFKLKFKRKKYFQGVFSVLSLTISSLIFIFPVQIYYFGKVELRMFLSSVVTGVISSFVYFIGFIALFLSQVPILSNILFNCMYVLIYLFIFIVKSSNPNSLNIL